MLPLEPFGHAALRAGHDVLVAAQRGMRHNVERAGLAFAPVDDAVIDALAPVPARILLTAGTGRDHRRLAALP